MHWDNGRWSAGLGVYHIGETHDTGATTTESIYEQLGRPSYIEPHFTGGRTVYRYVIDPIISYNLSVGYRFARDSGSRLGGSRIRLGVVNLTDEAPPLASGDFGYNPSVNQSLLSGRTWSLEIGTTF